MRHCRAIATHGVRPGGAVESVLVRQVRTLNAPSDGYVTIREIGRLTMAAGAPRLVRIVGHVEPSE